MNNYENELIVSHSPHIITPVSVRRIMMYVIIALIPALISATAVFGIRALFLTFVCCCACAGSEYLWNRIMKKRSGIISWRQIRDMRELWPIWDICTI